MNRWDRMTAHAGWATLIVFTALSSYLNATATAFDPAATTARVNFHAAVPPVMLVAALVAELVALSSVHRTARAVVVTGLVAVFVWTLAASYVAIWTVVEAWNPTAPAWINAGLAAVPDLVMVMGGVSVLSLRMRRHGTGPAESRAPRPSRLRRLADAATARAEAALAVPQPAADPSAAPSADVPADVPGDGAGPPASLSAEPPAASAAKPRKTSAKPSAKPASKPSSDPALAPFMEAGKRLEQARLVRGKTAVDYARILRATAEGWTPTRIKSEYGYSHGTTKAVLDAADAGSAAEPARLTAVH